jgi:hypothetical protein
MKDSFSVGKKPKVTMKDRTLKAGEAILDWVVSFLSMAATVAVYFFVNFTFFGG